MQQNDNPSEMYFLIRGDQINTILAYISKRPLEEVVGVFETLKQLRSVNINTTPPKAESQETKAE